MVAAYRNFTVCGGAHVAAARVSGPAFDPFFRVAADGSHSAADGIFAISLYVGFFGAGAGLLIMATLSFAGIDSVHEINALKTIITSTSNTVAAVTFIFYGAVLWRYGAAMMIAGSIGGYLTARLATKHKPRGIRALVVTMGCIVTIYFFYKLY